MLGYPTRPTLKDWVNEFAPETRKTRKSAINCTRQQKEEAVLAFCTRTESADKVAEDVGVTRQALYRWKEQLLGKEDNSRMPKKPKKQEVNELKDEVKQLQDEIYKLRMEKNILEKASELLKKEQGINLEFLTNREKTILIDALRENHKLKDLLIYVGIPKSSYSYHKAQLAAPDKYEKERKKS